ncbi:hypothetical protein CBR_g58143 [Chara braunii]|uniref:Uncharacterized protein n=1 Tax=Chara braunii TaxID=69332 RepID=A0A388MEV0_CHABU|nr:hypothetical protein CBR_g58143 [Chara braunii]|eukprot:GBG93005.1 hypothetical protein CBR_g58143 [Chara braunii]
MSALPIIVKQNSPTNRERELGLDRRETGSLEGDAEEGDSPINRRTLLHNEVLSKSRVAWECSPNWVVCDALRCSGPHARYTDESNESLAWVERPG